MSYSEDQVKTALARIDGLWSFKPGDRDINWKPADFLLWWLDPKTLWPKAGMLEVKQNDAKTRWNVSGMGSESLRPSQLAAVARCRELQMSYFVAVYWKAHRHWTLHDVTDARWPTNGAWAIDFTDAYSTLGVGAAPANLASTLAAVIHGEAGL